MFRLNRLALGLGQQTSACPPFFQEFLSHLLM